MVFNRKVLVVALMAVALLGSSGNAKAGFDRRHLRTHRAAAVDLIENEWVEKMASGTSLAPQATLAMDAKEILEVGIPKLL